MANRDIFNYLSLTNVCDLETLRYAQIAITAGKPEATVPTVEADRISIPFSRFGSLASGMRKMMLRIISICQRRSA